MPHCPSCTCQPERLSEYHARCPGETCDHAATPIRWLEKQPGLCEECTKRFYKEHPHAEKKPSWNPLSGKRPRLRDVGCDPCASTNLGE